MSKRSSPGNDKSNKKQKKEQGSLFNFFGSLSEPIDLTEDNSNDSKPASSSSSKQESIANGNANATIPKKKFAIFCDLDGVLVDFNAGVKKINRGIGADDMQSKQLWGSISRAYRFFQGLPWMEDGKKLWSTIVNDGYTPDILTGVPFVNGCREQKFIWCKRELGYAFSNRKGSIVFNHVDYASPKSKHERLLGSKRTGDNICNIITCWSKNKHCESREGRVLIDDRADLGVKWTAKGGIFIHHTDTVSTLRKMVEKGILSANVLTEFGDTGPDYKVNDVEKSEATNINTNDKTKKQKPSSSSDEVISLDD